MVFRRQKNGSVIFVNPARLLSSASWLEVNMASCSRVVSMYSMLCVGLWNGVNSASCEQCNQGQSNLVKGEIAVASLPNHSFVFARRHKDYLNVTRDVRLLERQQ